MYARTVEHGGAEWELDFGVSGKLIMNVLVMYDRQTTSYWGQLLGEAVDGPLEGATLTAIPARQTTWGEWRQLYPETLALVTDGGGRYDTYSSYYGSRSRGVLGESREDDRLEGKELVVGVVVDDMPAAFAHTMLGDAGVVNVEVNARPIAVAFASDTAAAAVFDRRVDGRVLTFAPGDDPLDIVDHETGSTWFVPTGAAVTGPLAGAELSRLPSTSSFWFGWKDWYPETALFGAHD